ncbi:MAG: diphthamide synthesis protein [Candidatus Woesearchaeota archaeon]|jgi:2-(3-amino-3-carboxypropyl)histidine synthase
MNQEYDLEMEKVISEITKNNSKIVLLHLPDGLKPKAGEIQKEIQKKTNALVLIWAGSNFGACDLPVDTERIGVDLIIHFGHSAWVY